MLLVMLSPSSFEEAFFCFMALLDVDFSSGFGCTCGPSANMNVIADGIFLTFKKGQVGLPLSTST